MTDDFERIDHFSPFRYIDYLLEGAVVKLFQQHHGEREYLRIVKDVLKRGVRKETRQGIDALTIEGAMFQHDMSLGFPLLTTKRMAKKSIMVELEGFLHGITDKQWYQQRGCHIWDEWCNPQKVPYSHDAETKQRMKEERDLGPIYGFQWRHFGAEYKRYDKDYTGQGTDQLEELINTLKKDPHQRKQDDRRMLVTAWDPRDEVKREMALPPCHYGFQVTVTNNKLNLFWNQRSVDVMLGLPFNIASYGLLLHLLAKETKLGEGTLTGFLADVHIFENHRESAYEQLKRIPYPLPRLHTEKFSSLFTWQHTQTNVVYYQHHPAIKMEVAV